LLATDYLPKPEVLNDTARLFGFGEKTGIDLPGEIAGCLPKDLKTNRTGLYSYAMGQHAFVSTPLQTALFFASLCQGHLYKPQIYRALTGINRTPIYAHLHTKDRFSKENALCLAFPFFPSQINITIKKKR
jgi:cell division protein FtsI/penicillin-binding protein 2